MTLSAYLVALCILPRAPCLLIVVDGKLPLPSLCFASSSHFPETKRLPLRQSFSLCYYQKICAEMLRKSMRAMPHSHTHNQLSNSISRFSSQHFEALACVWCENQTKMFQAILNSSLIWALYAITLICLLIFFVIHVFSLFHACAWKLFNVSPR